MNKRMVNKLVWYFPSQVHSTISVTRILGPGFSMEENDSYIKTMSSMFTKVLRETHTVLNQVRVARDQFPSFLGTALTGIYLARLIGSDGREDHCVVISQKWIFDSNFPNALPRTQESLDWCCSSDEQFPQIVHFPKVKATT